MAITNEDDIQTLRFPLLGASTARETSETKDQRFVNGYFDVLKNPVTNKQYYYFTKRPGLSTSSAIRPPGGNAVGRGMYYWGRDGAGVVYSCFGNKLYSGTTDLGVTLRTSTGRVSFQEIRATAATPMLAVSDNTDLYVISTTDAVTVINNVAITSSSVANPTVITTATAHGLATGNRVIIRNHSGSTPSINDTVYAVTVTGANTFTIPVNVTVGGTGGTIGVFPTPTVGNLVYMDGYLFALARSGAIYNCALDDARSWPSTNFITPIMDNGYPVGLARQSNYILFFGDFWSQGFYNAANPTGSPLANYEPLMSQLGCAAPMTLVNEESYVTWVGGANTGGYSVFRLTGTTEPKDIGTPTIGRILNSEASGLFEARANLIRISGHVFYVLFLNSTNRTLVYDYNLDMWFEWEGTDGNQWPIADLDQYNSVVGAQHSTNGYIYTLSPTTGQDHGVDFTMLARTSRMDCDTNDWKYVHSVSLLGDKYTTTTPVSLSYSDDDYQTTATARTLDLIDYNPYATNLGRFRRRSWTVSYTGDKVLRLEGLQMKYRTGIK